MSSKASFYSLEGPKPKIMANNAVVTKDGGTTTGRLLNQDAFTVQLMDPKERLRSFSKKDLKEFVFIDTSPMPSYQGKLSAQELADVLSYLVSLKGINKQ